MSHEVVPSFSFSTSLSSLSSINSIEGLIKSTDEVFGEVDYRPTPVASMRRFVMDLSELDGGGGSERFRERRKCCQGILLFTEGSLENGTRESLTYATTEASDSEPSSFSF